jgi:thiamine pyrophosphate-dependent acetolactate synthase large subunit-like protein
MIRCDVIEALARWRNGAASISGPGTISRLLWSAGHEDASIYQMDMGYATSMALGLALARPNQRVVSVEGDGSIIAAMSVFSTVARYQPRNLLILIIDNGSFASAGDGSIKTGSSFGTDIAMVACGCGIDETHVVVVKDEVQSEAALQRACTEDGPWVVVAKVDDSDRRVMQGAKSRGAIPFDVVETVINFRREMARRDAST